MMLHTKGEEDENAKHPDQRFCLPPISGGATQARVDRRRPISRLGMLRMRMVVQPSWFTYWHIY